MDRRHLLQWLGGSALALPLLASVPSAFAATSVDPLTRAARQFRASRHAHPVLAGFEDVPGTGTARVRATVRGRWPRALEGALYRNGPGRWERGGQRYAHWFDGDGLVQHWEIADGRVYHQSRFVQTAKWQEEQRAGRFVHAAAGTSIANHRVIRSPDDLNTANISVLALGDRVYALWEAGSAHEIDPATLATRGVTAWRPDLAAVPFSAHPLRDVDGSVWNFGMFGSRLLLWHLGPDGAVRDFRMHELVRGGYMHSFAQTATRLVFVLAPLWIDVMRGSFFESLRWHGEAPSLALVIDKNDLGAAPRVVELPAGMAYHYADAWDAGAGAVELRASWYDDGGTASSPFSGYMRGDMALPGAIRSRTVALRLPSSGAGRLTDLEIAETEFPVPRQPAVRADLLCVQAGPQAQGFSDVVLRIDAGHRLRGRHAYGPQCACEEHLWVRDGKGREYALGTVFDWSTERTGLMLLDAAHLDDGPIAEAWLPRAMPLGFHGCWVG